MAFRQRTSSSDGTVTVIALAVSSTSCASAAESRAARIRARHDGPQPHQRPVRITGEGDVSHRQGADRLAVIATGQTDEAALGGASHVAPIVCAHLQRDLDGRRTIASVEGVAQTRESRQFLGEFNDRRVSEAGQHYVVQSVELLYERQLDARVRMTEQVDPPRADAVQISSSVGAVSFGPVRFAAREVPSCIAPASR